MERKNIYLIYVIMFNPHDIFEAVNIMFILDMKTMSLIKDIIKLDLHTTVSVLVFELDS
jgi:hypothetical protein